MGDMVSIVEKNIRLSPCAYEALHHIVNEILGRIAAIPAKRRIDRCSEGIPLEAELS